MPISNSPSSSFADSKPHFMILDGLRGIAALVVVCFHLFEAFASSHLDQVINHGYLAVDFFFILSGFVIGYAYDDRWDAMSTMEFLKRRFIRLHPMVVFGAVLGGALFYFQGCSVWDVTQVSIMMLLISTLLNMFLIPSSVAFEIRGVGEMFPLNGPSWSLFFEYVGSILYMFFLRKLSIIWLKIFVLLGALALAGFAIFSSFGDLCVGYSLESENFLGGALRLLFGFSSGLLLSRMFNPVKIRGMFWIGAILIIAVCSIPRIGGADNLWINGIYDALCCIALFPTIVYLSASSDLTNEYLKRICKILGDISYPLYMIHYPFIYIYFAWVKNEELSFQASLPGALALFFGCIMLAYLSLKFYDEPVRKFLSRLFLRTKR